MNAFNHGTYVNGVHRPLIDALGDLTLIRTAFMDRYSTEEEGGMDSQVARHMALYPEDPEVRSYLDLISEGTFANHPRKSSGSISTEGSPAWISARDVHHEAKGSLPLIAAVRFADKLFARVSMSAVERDIRRFDGSEDNVYTVFLVALLRACPNLEEVRWAGDHTRASRIGVNWSVLLREFEENHVRMSFANKSYSLHDPGSRVMLSVMGAVSSEDDPVRRDRMLSGQIAKWSTGVFALGPQFLKYGWDLPRRSTGTVPSGAKPIPDFEEGKVMGKFFELFADETPPSAIVQCLAEFESRGLIRRRAGNLVEASFQDALASTDPKKCAKVVARVARTVTENGIPSPQRPSESALSEYLAGGDPSSIFDIPQRLAIATPETFRTGVWLRALKSSVRRKNQKIMGFTAISFGDDISKSYFIIPCPMAWPVDEKTGEVIERFGISDDVLRRAAVRILRSLRPNNAGPKGGRAHRSRAERRAFQNFVEWQIGDSVFYAWASPGSRSGLVNTTIHQQPKTSPRPWSHIRNDPTHPSIATIRQTDLMAAIAQNLAVDIPDSLLALSQTFASVQVERTQSDRDLQHNGLMVRSERAAQEAKENKVAAAGARKLAATMAEKGDLEQSQIYMEDASGYLRKAKDQEEKCIAFREQANQNEIGDQSGHVGDPIETDLSIVAYMSAALSKSLERKRVTEDIGTYCDKLFSDWVFEPYEGPEGEPLVRYSVAFQLPVEGDSVVKVILQGSIKNVRGKRLKSQQGKIIDG